MSLDLTSYLRKNSGTSSYTFYGYSTNPNAADGDSTWAIRKVTPGETTTWTNGVIDFVSSWSTATQSFLTPSGALGVTYSSNNTNYYRISWSDLSGVEVYTVTTKDSNGQILTKGGSFYTTPHYTPTFTSKYVNGSMHDQYLPSNATYSIVVTAINVAGQLTATVSISL